MWAYARYRVPARDKTLHGLRIVASARIHRAIHAVCLRCDLGPIEFRRTARQAARAKSRTNRQGVRIFRRFLLPARVAFTNISPFVPDCSRITRRAGAWICTNLPASGGYTICTVQPTDKP